MKHAKDVEFRYFRVLHTCDKRKGEPHIHCLRSHRRHTYPWVLPPNPRGGMVVCHLWLGGRVFATGVSLCSMSDNFNYRTGRAISYGRALKQAKEKLKADRLREANAKAVDMASVPKDWEYSKEAGGWVHQRTGGKTIYPQVPATP